MQKKYTWYKIADSNADLFDSESNLVDIEIAGKKICIVNNGESINACASKCPHAGGQMSKGYIDALGNIVCPLHRYKFSLENGRNTSGEGYFLKTYPIDIRENGIFIGIEEQSMFNWLK